MDKKEFRDLVKRMREAQREYFQRRQFDALRRSRDLESLVDAELDREDMPGLF